MDCSTSTMTPGCAVDESVIPSLLSVLTSNLDEERHFDVPDDNRNQTHHGLLSQQRLRRQQQQQALDHLDNQHEINTIESSPTPDTEESSAFSSTMGIINAFSAAYNDTSQAFLRRARQLDENNVPFVDRVSSFSSLGSSADLNSNSSSRIPTSRLRQPEEISNHSLPVRTTVQRTSSPSSRHTKSHSLSSVKEGAYADFTQLFACNIPKTHPDTNDNKSKRTLRQAHSMPVMDFATITRASPTLFTSQTLDNIHEIDDSDTNDRLRGQQYDQPQKQQQLIHRISVRGHSESSLPPPPTDDDATTRHVDSFATKLSEDAISTHKILVTRSYEVKEHVVESIFYVSTSAILGSIVRTYLARIFGFDCEFRLVNDFLTPLTSQICVTNGGRTLQTGGAIFYDFPANVFGSFIMGFITPRATETRGRFPWLHKDHPLQRDDVFHASLATGFCGCLTTFASWNTQMVVMLDGKYCKLGSQVVTVLFGYTIGLMGATCGFQFGRQCGVWMHNLHTGDIDSEEKESNDEELAGSSGGKDNIMHLYHDDPQTHDHQGIELIDDDEAKLQPVPNHLHKIPLALVAAAFLAAFLVGNLVQHIPFYQVMTYLWFLSPLGSLLRWRMSAWNLTNGKIGCLQLPRWVPWGTFLANILAVVVAACLTGINDRYFSILSMEKNWLPNLLSAVISGFAGSLSTVSTMIKETVWLSEQHVGFAKAQYYAVGTCLCGMVCGLAVYSVTVRA